MIRWESLSRDSPSHVNMRYNRSVSNTYTEQMAFLRVITDHHITEAKPDLQTHDPDF